VPRQPTTAPPPNESGIPFLWATLGFSLLAFLAFQIYRPALHGPFLFDDLFLPFTRPHAAIAPLSEWCGVRPLLGLSFWATFQFWGLDTFPYHVTNVLLHFGAAVFLYLIVRKLLSLAGTEALPNQVLSAFAAALFLLHPVQTEAVAYVASRSETLSVFFLFAAFTVFLYRRQNAILWGVSAVVLLLFACGLATKEYAIAFPALLLLTDYFWNPGFRLSGIRANWRLYAPLTLLAGGGLMFVWRYLSSDGAIGFKLRTTTWYEYFFTECRAFFSYIRLFLFPIGQNVDHDFPISRTLFDHGALIALICLAALLIAAFVLRRRLPLACYGLFVFVLLLAPTSSFIPIRDVFVERRLYLPFIGLLLIVLELLRRIDVKPAILAAVLAFVCAFAGVLTWQRAHVWNNNTLLWQDAAAKSPNKARVRFGLANAYLHERRCQEALSEYDAASRLQHPDYILYFNWASAYDCLHQPDLAAGLLQKATADRPTASAYALLGLEQAQMRLLRESLASLHRAQELDPGYALTYAYRGMILLSAGRGDLAQANFAKCLEIDPANAIARDGWAKLNR
jgi:tetratricopeptide (TPR) repeat protein